MTDNQKILNKVSEYLEDNPEAKFTQALANLNINQFADLNNPEAKNFLLRNPYNDTDKQVLERIIL